MDQETTPAQGFPWNRLWRASFCRGARPLTSPWKGPRTSVWMIISFICYIYWLRIWPFKALWPAYSHMSGGSLPLTDGHRWWWRGRHFDLGWWWCLAEAKRWDSKRWEKIDWSCTTSQHDRKTPKIGNIRNIRKCVTQRHETQTTPLFSFG